MGSVEQNIRATVKLRQFGMRHVAGETNILQAALGNHLTQAPFLTAGSHNFERRVGEPLLDVPEGPYHRVDAVDLLQMAGYQKPGLDSGILCR